MLVKVEVECFVGGSLHQPGAVIEYEGPLSSWMTPVDGKAVDKEDAPVKQRGRKVTYRENSDLPEVVEV